MTIFYTTVDIGGTQHDKSRLERFECQGLLIL